MKKNIKTRFAPSPTGYLHIGGLRTALYNYLFAKQNKGKFILRIEDTDKARYVKNAEIKLIETLGEMGLNWDEGPLLDNDLKVIEKGQNKPYFQSKRLKKYLKYSQQLLQSGNAYYCFCSKGRLEKLRIDQQARKQPPMYDGYCRNLSKNDIEKKLETGENYVIRLKVPDEKIEFNDLIRGSLKIEGKDIDDQILIKSDGYPTYHLAVVVDDYEMKITHVIRGEEWLPSTPKHIILYQAFKWEVPVFAHLPLLLNPDKSKLSKRQGDVAVKDFLAKGYLPEALMNYVALLGWHPKDDKEVLNLKQLIKEFDLRRVQKAGAIFDVEKLNWFNSHYISKTSNNDLIKLCQKLVPKLDNKLLEKLIILEKDRLHNLSQIQQISNDIFNVPDFDPKLLIFKKSDKQKTLHSLEFALITLTDIINWDREVIKSTFEKIVKDNNLSNGDIFWPVRVAISGQEKSPPPEELMELIGKNESLRRIKNAIDKLK